MSHYKEREEKVCLNCNAALSGRFCHQCGQENIEPRETVWGLITHFFNDITHFDGKFFTSLKYLIRKPGFLPAEFRRGRRASYLNPIRMYVFSSAVFFLIFYNLYSVNKSFRPEDFIKKANRKTLNQLKEAAYGEAETKVDSARIDSGFALLYKVVESKPDTVVKSGKGKKVLDTLDNGLKISAVEFDKDYESKEQYDSVQRTLPANERDNWLEKMLRYKNIDLQQKYGENEKLMWSDVANKFLHMFPYMLFISLPLYALYLKLLYRRRKDFYYVDHIMFLIYLYIFTFLFLLVYFSLETLNDRLDSGWITLLASVYFLYGIYYTFRAMRNFYEQGFFKTLVKFLLLNVMALITLIVLSSVFFGLTFLQV